MLALTLIGIADAAYVAHGNYTGAPLWCPVFDGCNTVINSPYSRDLWHADVVLRLYYYVFMFGLAARLAYESVLEQLAFSGNSLRRVRRCFFDLLHVPSNRLYS